MQTHQKFFAKNCILPFLSKISYCCSHNCIIIDSMFSFQGANSESSLKDSMNHSMFPSTDSVNLSWWRLAGSNRWPPACKAGALPAELNPHIFYLKWWAKMDSNHRPHDYQSCALASWAIGPYQLHFFRAVPSKLNSIKFFHHLVLTLGHYK